MGTDRSIKLVASDVGLVTVRQAVEGILGWMKVNRSTLNLNQIEQSWQDNLFSWSCQVKPSLLVPAITFRGQTELYSDGSTFRIVVTYQDYPWIAEARWKENVDNVVSAYSSLLKTGHVRLESS